MKQKLLKYLAIKIGPYLHLYAEQIAEQSLPHFTNRPRNLSIELPYSIGHPDRIQMGDDVTLGPGCRLITVTEYPGTRMGRLDMQGPLQKFDPRITIGNRVSATAQLQVFAQEQVTIEDDVMFASNVFINDGSHGYRDGNAPYKYQPLEGIAPINIKRGSWIGQNVVVLGGVGHVRLRVRCRWADVSAGLEAVAVPVDAKGRRVVQQPVGKRHGEHRVREDR